MKTLVEFFDDSAIKNLIATISLKPEKLLMVADAEKTSKRKLNEFCSYLKAYCKTTDFEIIFCDFSSTQSLNKAFMQITHTHKEVVFNITGGGELAVVSVSMYCNKMNLPAFFIDLKAGVLSDIIGKSDLEEAFALPTLSVKQSIALNGASFKRCDHYVPDIHNEALLLDLFNIFDIFIQNTEEWYGFVAYMQEVGKYPSVGVSGLSITAPSYIEINPQRRVRANPSILKSLENTGIISELRISKQEIAFTIKDEMILAQLKLQGSWLEQFCYIHAHKMHYFDDVKMSVVIDADGDIDDFATIQNEIDLIVTKGITPLFISCKSSAPSALSLSEISQLASKFGGNTAKAAIATSVVLSRENPSIYKRAMEMGIYVIEHADLNAEHFPERMQEIFEGTYRYAYPILSQ